MGVPRKKTVRRRVKGRGSVYNERRAVGQAKTSYSKDESDNDDSALNNGPPMARLVGVENWTFRFCAHFGHYMRYYGA